MTLACEDANSKLVEVVTVAVDAEDYVGNGLLQILKLRFGHKALLLAQGLVKIFKLKFRRDFEADVSDEDRVGNSLLQIRKLRFGHKAYTLVNILKLKVQARF